MKPITTCSQRCRGGRTREGRAVEMPANGAAENESQVLSCARRRLEIAKGAIRHFKAKKGRAAAESLRLRIQARSPMGKC